MVTVILPIRVEQNSFWNSSVGIECIKRFIDYFRKLSDVDRLFVITRDDQVGRVAKKRGMTVSEAVIPGDPYRPYSFEQTRALARNVQYLYTNQADGLIIADHRNLFLSGEDISRAHKAYLQNPESGVISLVPSNDHPCQFKSYYNYIDFAIRRFEGSDNDSKLISIYPDDHGEKLDVKSDGHGRIATEVSASDSRCCISFQSWDLQLKYFIAQIIPFDQYGPIYGKSKEVLVRSPQEDILIEIGTGKAKGILFVFAEPAQSGVYDTMEFFTPENAPWEIGESISTVFSKINHEPMYDRRQFPPVYTYDGSLCILNRNHLPEKAKLNPFLLMLNESCIVTDWVDYWFTATSHHTATGFET